MGGERERGRHPGAEGSGPQRCRAETRKGRKGRGEEHAWGPRVTSSKTQRVGHGGGAGAGGGHQVRGGVVLAPHPSLPPPAPSHKAVPLSAAHGPFHPDLQVLTLQDHQQ